mgnify:FL=1
MANHQDIKEIGQTLDDSAGEAFDKVAAMLGLPYPGGPSIEKEAKNLKPKTLNLKPIKLPRPMIDSDDFNFSFSGLKTAVLYKVKQLANSLQPTAKNKDKKAVSRLPLAVSQAIAAEFQQAVIDVLIAKTLKAAHKYRVKSICLSGGVSANSRLRHELESKTLNLTPKTLFFAPAKNLSTDNAAMIGVAAAYKVRKKWLASRSIGEGWNKIQANANLKI